MRFGIHCKFYPSVYDLVKASTGFVSSEDNTGDDSFPLEHDKPR